MVSLLLSFLALFQGVTNVPFDVRARESLVFGKGASSGSTYYDVVITRQPSDGVLIRLPYTRKGGRFTFDLHHRIAMTPDFASPAEVTTVVEVLTGGTTSIGTYTMSGKVRPGDKPAEAITKSSTAELDKFVDPQGSKTVVLTIRPGPQSISIVGLSQVITRGTATARIDTPNARIATISKLKFEEVTEVNPLKKTP